MYKHNMIGAAIAALFVALHAHAVPMFDKIFPAPNGSAPPSTYVQVSAYCPTINVITNFELLVNGSAQTSRILVVGSTSYKVLTWQPSVLLPSGSNVYITARCTDDTGFTVETNFHFLVNADVTPPAITFRSPGETNNNVKIIQIEVTATDESGMSSNVTFLVDGVPRACTVVQNGNSINAQWRSSLLPTGAHVFAQMTVRDTYGNSTNIQWHFDSTSTIEDWCDIHCSGLFPAPQSDGVNPYSPISAMIDTRLDYCLSNIIMLVNGATVTPVAVGVDYSKTVQYVPAMPFVAGVQVQVTLFARDTGGRAASTSWWFMVEAPPTNEHSSILLLNVWPQYAGPSQSVHVAWAQRDPGQVTLLCGTNQLYTFTGDTSDMPQMVAITPQQRAQWGLPAEGSNLITALHITGSITQRTARAFCTVRNLALATKENKTGTPDFDGDRIVVTYVGPGTARIEGRTITVPGDAKATLTVSTLVPKGAVTDGRTCIDSIIVSNGLKSLISRNVSIGEIYAPSASIGSVIISGGDLGRPSVVTALSNQVNGLLAARVVNVLVKGGSIYGDVVVACATNTTPVSITCIAGKNKLTKLPVGGSLVNVCISTAGCNIKQITAKGGAGFIVQPDDYRSYRTYGAVMAGVAYGYVAPKSIGMVVPQYAILKVSMVNCRWMGDWVTARAAIGHKLTGAYLLREDTWYVDSTAKYLWNGRN